MSKWIVCTVCHEAYEFDSEEEAMVFKEKTDGAFSIHKRENMNKYYFTFGMNHETRQGYSLGNNFVVIEAVSETVARDKMWDARSDKWAFSYTEEEFSGQQEKYGLTSLTLEQVTL